MQEIKEEVLTGERALFRSDNLEISYSTFLNGESPLKESSNLKLKNNLFKLKYPLWYCNNVEVENTTFFEMARAGIWYTKNVSLKNCTIEAPKNFRRAENIRLEQVNLSNAAETLWNCNNVYLKEVTAQGDYFAMNSRNLKIDEFSLVGNYSFDGCKDIEISNSKLLSKDAFWNCENVTVTDSFISGEYIGWNSSDLTFINCTIESLQGFCYIENLTLINCTLLNTNLAFEYSTVDVQVNSKIDSIKNPAAGRIEARKIDQVILDKTEIEPAKTEIISIEIDKDNKTSHLDLKGVKI
jgi:hypothetical protein